MGSERSWRVCSFGSCFWGEWQDIICLVITDVKHYDRLIILFRDIQPLLQQNCGCTWVTQKNTRIYLVTSKWACTTGFCHHPHLHLKAPTSSLVCRAQRGDGHLHTNATHHTTMRLWAHMIYNKSKILSREMIETVLTNNSRKRRIFKPTLIPWKTIKGETACTFPNTMSCLSLAQFAMVQAPEMSAVKLISQCERKPNNGTLW